MYTRRDKIANIDYIYIWTFLVSMLVFIYFNFEGFWVGEVEKHTGMTITDNTERIKSICRLIMIITSLMFFHRTYSINKLTALGKTLLIFSLYLLLSCFLLKDFNNITHYISTYTIMSVWIFIYLFFYTLCLRYEIDKYINKFVVFFTIFSAILFIRNYILNIGIGHTDWHYIESYYVITLIPAFLLLQNKYKYSLLILTMICAIISAKRTGLITSVIVIIIYFILIGKNIGKKIKSILLGATILVTLYFTMATFMGEQLDFIIERIANIEEDDGSGRGDMYTNLFDEITKNDDTATYLFGNGYDEVINSKINSGYSAHNEFLEVLYDYGLVGFSIFTAIFIAIYNMSKKTKEHKHKVSVQLSLLIFIMFSLTSHTILYTTNIIFLCMFWGYNDARNKILKY